MKGTPAIYLGRIVDKNNFRVFVYGPNGEKKLVKSWEAYEIAMASGIWFSTIEDVKAIKSIVNEPEKLKDKSKSTPQPKDKEKSTKNNEIKVIEPVKDNGMLLEVKE